MKHLGDIKNMTGREHAVGKALPEILHAALLDMIEWWETQEPTP